MSNIMGDESPTAPGFISTELFQCQGLDAVITTFLLCGLCLAYFGRGNSRPFLGQRDKDRKVFASRASLEKAKKENNIRLSNAFQSHDGHAIKKDMALTTPEMGQQSWSYPAPVDPSVDRDAHIVRIAKSGYPYDAHNMLRQSLEFGHQPKQGTFATVMHMYAKVGSIKQAMCVVHEMQSAEIQFDVTTYNLIMDAWLRAGDALAAQCWMRRMLDKGVRPNVISFGIIFRACATAGRFEDLEKWFTHAQQLGFDFSLASLDETVKVIARSGDAVNAMKWLRIAIDHGVQPSIRCFMAVLKAIDSKSDVELATDIIDMMRLGSVQPDGAFFSQCVVLAAQNGHHAKAQQWARDCVSAKGTLSKAAMHWNPTRYGKEQERVHHDVDRSRMFLDRKEPDSYRRLMAAKNNGWVKAVFLRDPVARLLSAYYSKVALGKLEGKGYPHTLSFADFVARIEAEGLNVDTNEHWRPQSYTCNLNETIQKYDIVGSFDKLDEDAHRMVDLVGGPELARSMLDDGWGPYGNQSLFGVPRLVREEGCAGCAMPVTHGGSDVVESFSEIRVGEHAERQGDAAAQNVHSSRVASEAAFVRLMQRKLSFNPELTSRIKRLYAMDYALLDRANDPIRP